MKGSRVVALIVMGLLSLMGLFYFTMGPSEEERKIMSQQPRLEEVARARLRDIEEKIKRFTAWGGPHSLLNSGDPGRTLLVIKYPALKYVIDINAIATEFNPGFINGPWYYSKDAGTHDDGIILEHYRTINKTQLKSGFSLNGSW